MIHHIHHIQNEFHHYTIKATINPPIKRGWRRSAPLLQRCELALARWGLAGRGMELFLGPGNISETEQLLGDLYEHLYALERIITHYYYYYLL